MLPVTEPISLLRSSPFRRLHPDECQPALALFALLPAPCSLHLAPRTLLGLPSLGLDPIFRGRIIRLSFVLIFKMIRQGVNEKEISSRSVRG
uniref:Uncharacterized protein n=1 Tax=Vespula pensylvanica TaxID=30213 RepID=A0A834NS35_VESPE|nr:hypothetical protein H0235_011482 [Vespula pensylvanica]